MGYQRQAVTYANYKIVLPFSFSGSPVSRETSNFVFNKIENMLTLTKKERNEIFNEIRTFELDPQRFVWESHTSRHVFRYEEHFYQAVSGDRPQPAEALVITHNEDEFSFTFERDDHGSFYASIEPHISKGHSIRANSWHGLIQAFRDWLEVIRFEIEEPDLWSQLSENRPSDPLTFVSESPAGLELFDEEEVEAIAQNLKQIEKFILESKDFDSHSIHEIQQTFSYLKKKAESTSRLDWKNIFVGAIVSIIMEHALEKGAEIFAMCRQLIGPIFSKVVNLIN